MNKKSIELGRFYKNQWNETRLPFLEEDGYVHYLHSAPNGRLSYNPYRNCVSSKEFLKKWTPTEFDVDESKLGALSEMSVEIGEEWVFLLAKAAQRINKILLTDENVGERP